MAKIQVLPSTSAAAAVPSAATLPLPPGILRARSLVERGLSRQQIKALADAGHLVHLERGLYSLPDSPVTENHGLAQVAARVSHGVVCLASALQFHHLTTQLPWRVSLMLPRGARPPKIAYPPIEIVWAGDASFSAGIETIGAHRAVLTCVFSL